MAFSKNLHNMYVQTKHQNEGFLYIDTVSTETFKRGEIKDSDGVSICPGIIVPIINPIQEANREKGDEHLASIESFKNRFNHFYPLKKNKKIRIYWLGIQEAFVISNELQIYPDNDVVYNVSTVNFDLLDKTKCYYCLTDPEKGVILTNIVDKAHPILANSYNIDEDLAFAHHITISDCTHIPNMLLERDKYEHGILCVLHDGRQVELRSIAYHYYCTLAKPDYISSYIYYIMALNKHAEGMTFGDYFHSLHDYIREFTDAYPEYTDVCNTMTTKLQNYINTFEFENMTEMVTTVNKLLEMEPEMILQVLYKY